MQTESDGYIRKIWERLLEQEIAHLHAAVRLLEDVENKTAEQVIPNAEFPKPLTLCSNIEYVRKVLAESVQMTGSRESYACVNALKPDVDFFRYQEIVNHDVCEVSSHVVIEDHICACDGDYRFEVAPNPIPQLRNRCCDNTQVGRTPGAADGCNL